MKTSHVGLIILSFAVIVLYLNWSYTKTMTEIVTATCTHGLECTMYTAINLQKNNNNFLIIILAFVGTYFLFHETLNKYLRKRKIYPLLNDEEKQIYNLAYNKGFEQSKLISELKISKVRLTRVLDRMEKRGIIERMRKGQQNLVIIR